MKKLIKKTIAAIICTLFMNSFINAQTVQIGHRDAQGNAVLDLTASYFQATASNSLSSNGFIFQSIVNLELNDKPLMIGYYKNLTMGVNFADANGVQYAGNYYFTLVYDNAQNKYYLDQSGGGLGGVQNGGGRITCTKINCLGCDPIQGSNGNPKSCSDCTAKVDPAQQSGPDCLMGAPNGNGPGWLTAIGGLFVGLLGLL